MVDAEYFPSIMARVLNYAHVCVKYLNYFKNTSDEHLGNASFN